LCEKLTELDFSFAQQLFTLRKLLYNNKWGEKMGFTVSSRAVALYKKEMNLQAGDAIQLYCRFLGASQAGFTLGVAKDSPNKEDYMQSFYGIIFFVKPSDYWFVENMYLDYDPEKDEMIAEFPSLL
jgi:uncharacterized protein YneR